MNTTVQGVQGSSGNNVLSTQSTRFGDNPFLSLLLAQLHSQTPLEPVDNNSFMQQMSAYSSMTEQKELNDNMLKLLDYQGVLARLQGLSEGSALLGKQVTWEVDGKEQSGLVQSVYIDEQGDVRVKLGDDREISMRQITGIRQPQAGGKEGTDGTGLGSSQGQQAKEQAA